MTNEEIRLAESGTRKKHWNEDGLAGISDRRQMICFALAL
jgi:hypothetical protein